jgi:hypothetical protein
VFTSIGEVAIALPSGGGDDDRGQTAKAIEVQ